MGRTFPYIPSQRCRDSASHQDMEKALVSPSLSPLFALLREAGLYMSPSHHPAFIYKKVRVDFSAGWPRDHQLKTFPRALISHSIHP